ncbi:Rab guanine nucleotide exchange factor sec2 [Colletotrichum gloeosporioides]|uniref:Rab guanine nucleotide exchange factor sec2 n=1 Tax=Colletotrichum gloeosporioides TaxID=474922 RepID=A0A8H4CE99_COLGL|nr:Rab guanine nucleotide exchange factor sec2 [Colletotrichum gloeosporioides]KAF3802304.1 Rab guanine nucleotide exchange factor sec2 [Colletotrichum gloeosporioides]
MDSFIAVAGWAQHTSPQPGSRPFGHFRSLSSIARSPSPSPKATRITGKAPSVADVPIMSSSLASTPSSPSLRPTPVSPPEDEGELSTLPDPRSRAMSPASDADTSHHPDLDDEVATLSTKLINAINHQTTLDDTLTATRQELERAREQIKHLEEQNASQREMLAGDIWVRRKVVEEEKKTILLRVTNERKLREDVEKEKKKIEQELENLTTALFEEANNMVISAKEEARIEQEALQRKNDNLRSQLGDMEALLTSQQQQLADLKQVMEQMALEREEGTTGTAPSSPGFSKSEFKDDERPDGVLASPLVDPSSPTYPTSLTHLIQPVLRTDLGSYEDFVALTRISRNRAGSRVSSGSFNGISGLGLGMGGSTSSAHPSNASTASLSTAGTPASSSPQTPNTPASVSSTASANLGPPPPALKETKFFKRVLAEDVEPTLRLDIAPGLSWLARRSVLNAMSDGSIVVEPIPANAPFASIVKPQFYPCSLCGDSRKDDEHLRTYRFRTNESESAQRYPLCKYCLGRVRSTCDFLNFLRILKDGHWRADDEDAEKAAWEESVRLREQMFWSRIGGGVIPASQPASSGSEKSPRSSHESEAQNVEPAVAQVPAIVEAEEKPGVDKSDVKDADTLEETEAPPTRPETPNTSNRKSTQSLAPETAANEGKDGAKDGEKRLSLSIPSSPEPTATITSD